MCASFEKKVESERGKKHLPIPILGAIAERLHETESHPNYPKFERLLSPGWIPGRKVDNSDQQYSNFRDNIPILAGVLTGHFLLRRGFNALFSKLFPTPPHNSSYRPSHNINRRKYFDILFAVIFLTALHSLSIIKILVILTANWLISFFHPSSIFVPILTWGFNIGVLFANEYFEGYHFRLILPWLIAGEGAGVGYAMDHFLSGGLLPRWEISFNITVLRLISYNMDHYWAAKRLEEADDVVAGRDEGSVLEVRSLIGRGDVERADGKGEAEVEEDSSDDAEAQGARLILEQKKKLLDPTNISERDRIDTPAAIEDYGFFNYLAYVLYSPLYLAGPIITFNDFVHQVPPFLPSPPPRSLTVILPATLPPANNLPNSCNKIRPPPPLLHPNNGASPTLLLCRSNQQNRARL